MGQILITGGSGFIGSALKEALIRYNHSVTVLSSKDGDIADVHTLSKLNGLEIDTVFHLAGKSFVPDSWVSPREFIRVNFEGTNNVLEFCRKNKTQLVFISSYLYGNPSQIPTSEDAEIKTPNPYALSKSLAEQLVSNYCSLYDMDATVIRPFNVYGIGQNKRFLIPELISKFLNESIKEVEVLDPNPRRDFI